MKLPMLSHDKANHFVYGAVLAAAGLVFFDPLYVFVGTGIIAVAKEVWDKFNGGDPSEADVFATFAGIATVMLPGFVA